MQVTLYPDAAPRLDDPHDLKCFRVLAPFAPAQLALARERIAPAGELADGETAQIFEDWIRTWPACAGDAAWQDGVTAMLAYAARRGWYDAATRRIQAHVEWQPQAQPAGRAP